MNQKSLYVREYPDFKVKHSFDYQCLHKWNKHLGSFDKQRKDIPLGI